MIATTHKDGKQAHPAIRTGKRPVNALPALPAARWIPQLAVILIVVGGATLRNLGFTAGWLPELRAICPFGALDALVNLDFERLAIPIGVLLVAVLMGAAFCGRLCPLGSLQEWIGRLGHRVLGRRYNRSIPGDRFLGYARYLVLAAVAATALGFLALETDYFNPSLALVHTWTSAVPITAVLLLVAVAVGSFFVERPWCRWLCPYGALLGAVGRVSPWTIRRNRDTCIDCGRCDRACPLAVRVASVDAVRDGRCNRCERCVAACPVDGTLRISARARAPRIRTSGIQHSGARLSAAALMLFFIPFLLARFPDAVTARGSGSDTGQTPSAEAVFDAERISPMMTLQNLADEAGLSTGELLSILALPPETDPDLMLIDIEEEPDQEHMTVGHIRSILSELRQ